jgi:hypothetical protein
MPFYYHHHHHLVGTGLSFRHQSEDWCAAPLHSALLSEFLFISITMCSLHIRKDCTFHVALFSPCLTCFLLSLSQSPSEDPSGGLFYGRLILPKSAPSIICWYWGYPKDF